MCTRHLVLASALALAACQTTDPAARVQTTPAESAALRAAQIDAWIADLSRGELQASGSRLDLAIDGAGFFRVRMPDGEYRYTRDGGFHLDVSNALVTGRGCPLDPQVQIPPDALEVIVGEDGSVNVLKSDSPLPEAVTSVSIFRFANPRGLQAQGGNLFSETTLSGQALQAAPGVDGAGSIRQGFLERSNVRVVDQLTALVLAQRIHEDASRTAAASDVAPR